MIPLLLISNDKKALDKYLNVNFKKNGNLFFEVVPATKEYSIDDIKNLIKETKVFYQKTRIYFLVNFHLSSIPAQNSFLRLLEEPPANVQFILNTNNKNNLLSTVVSRSKVVKLNTNQIPFINKVIKNNFEELIKSKNLKILNKPDFSQIKKDDALALFNEIIVFFRARLDSDKKAPLIIKEILHLKSLFKNNNLNPQLTIDQVLIFIYKCYNRYNDYKKR